MVNKHRQITKSVLDLNLPCQAYESRVVSWVSHVCGRYDQAKSFDCCLSEIHLALPCPQTGGLETSGETPVCELWPVAPVKKEATLKGSLKKNGQNVVKHKNQGVYFLLKEYFNMPFTVNSEATIKKELFMQW